MTPFVEVEVQQNEAAIREEGTAKLKELLEAAGVVGWEENPADLAIINLSTIASMVPALAEILAVVPPAIFRKFGTELAGIPYNEGTAATVTTTWTLLEEGGEYAAHTIEAGSQLVIGEMAFQVKENVSVAKGESSKAVVLVAAERGTAFNNLTGTVELVNALSWVKEVTIVGETSGGVDQESDEEYQDRLQAVLKLQAPRPITASNYAEMVLDANTGVTVGRATAIDGYDPSVIEIEGKPTTAKTDLKEVSTFVGVSVEKTAGAQTHPGSELHWKADGAGVYTTLARGTTMKAKLGAAEGELSVAAKASPAKGKIEVIGKYEQERTVTVFVLGKEGKTLTTEQRETLKKYLEERRELNFKIFVEPPSFNEVRVKAKIHVLPGFTASAVKANVKAAVEKFLAPENWGNPTNTSSNAQTWLNATEAFGVVRYNQIVGVIEAVQGVSYVFSGSAGLAIGLEEAPGAKTADLTLAGPAPLAECKAAEIVIEVE